MTPKTPTLVWVTIGEDSADGSIRRMGRAVKDLSPLWQAVLCVLLAALVMHCWSEEGESQPLDIVTIKRTSANRSTTSTPGPTRWEIAKRK